jgi:hypothetical protein
MIFRELCLPAIDVKVAFRYQSSEIMALTSALMILFLVDEKFK